MIVEEIIEILSERYIYLFLIFYATLFVLYYSARFENFIIARFSRRFVMRLSHKFSEPLSIVIFLISILSFSLFIFFLVMSVFPPKEYKEYEFVQQIERLDEIQNSLEDLQNLISTQKEKLINTEKYIELLKMEKQKLEPIVEANRELVESILTLQKERTISQVWKDRFIGFIISLLAGLTIIIFKNLKKLFKVMTRQ